MIIPVLEMFKKKTFDVWKVDLISRVYGVFGTQ